LRIACKIIIGLSGEQLKRLAITGRQFQKTARRDIAHVVSYTFFLKKNQSQVTLSGDLVSLIHVANIAAMEILNTRQLSYGS
jgi:pseudouridine-5'-phosphate glycosidase